MGSDGGPAQPSRTIGQAINGGFACSTPSDRACQFGYDKDIDGRLRVGRLCFMSIFKRKPLGNLVPIDAANMKTKDWVVLLEATTIVGPHRDKLRVALTTQERKLVKRRKFLRKTEHFLIVDGYDPRIHALYFCPQLYKKEDGALVPLSGQEIGQLMAQALQGGAIEKPPWYEPSDGMLTEAVIKASPAIEFDSLVVDVPSPKAAKPAALRAVVPLSDKETAKT
jgi:hypothetical protein